MTHDDKTRFNRRTRAARTCTRCSQKQPIGEFTWRSAESGWSKLCSTCRERQRRYTDTFKEKHEVSSTASTQKWRDENPETNKKRIKAWRDANPERVKEAARQCYARIKDDPVRLENMRTRNRERKRRERAKESHENL